MREPPQALRILIVDDHPLIRDGLRVVLRRSFPHAEVQDTGNPEDALHRVQQAPPDLVLLDVNLPRMNGLELLRRLRLEPTPSRVLMVAAEADPWTVRQALASGASGFVAKTRTTETLAAAVLAVTQGQPFLCEDSRAALDQAGASFPATKPEPGPAVLSDRERQILRYLAHGENTKSIALALEISPKTVETHRSHLMQKLGIDSVASLTRYAIRHGLTSP